MARVLIKADPSADMFVDWSVSAGGPVTAGPRSGLWGSLTETQQQEWPGVMLYQAACERALQAGSSDEESGWANWAADGISVTTPAGERWLPRARIGDYSVLALSSDLEAAFALTEPLPEA